MIQNSEGEMITIIGPKNSGKTTYLTGLAYWPERNNHTNSPFTIEPLNLATIKLQQEAQEKILQGVTLEPTELQPNSTVDDLPEYFLKIKIKGLIREEIIRLLVRDYPGEIYQKLATRNIPQLEKSYIKECMKPDVTGCLVLLDKWEGENDQKYADSMNSLIKEMDRLHRIKGDTKQGIKPLKIAVAMSKCERGEIWPSRLDPETDIVISHCNKGGLLRMRKSISSQSRNQPIARVEISRLTIGKVHQPHFFLGVAWFPRN